MDLNEAKNLVVGQVIHHAWLKNADGTPKRYKVNGEVKTWKRKSNAHYSSL